ncbi:MAG: GCAxxG family protein [Clostridia bacterium]|nr:GCAxxG family protein [Clostridia bacterium]
MGEKFVEVQDKAENYFNGGYNCCESVVLAVCEHLNIDSEMPLKIATPLGSGMSRNGSNCGALNAAFISMGMTKGRKSNEDSRDPAYIPADKIFNMFKEKYGSAACKDITCINMKEPGVMEKNKERLHRDICGPIVRQVTGWILEELEE